MTAAKPAPEPARHPLDVQLYLTEIAGHPATLILTADSIAVDTQAQRDQEKLLLEYLANHSNPQP